MGGSYAGSTEPLVVPNSQFPDYLTYGATTYNMVSYPTRTGYTFTGWYDAPTGGNAVWDVNGRAVNGVYWSGSGAQAVYAHDGDLSTYAHWTPTSYLVTLDQAGGTGGTPSVTATYNAPMPKIVPPTRAGYTFGGYYNADKTFKYYNADGTSARNWNWWGTATLHAEWATNTYVVSFDPGSGSGTMENQAFVYDVPQAITNCTFDPPSPGAPFWQFAGWSTDFERA